MRLDWLESFVAFCEDKNFTRAAERLHISQPALHVQIKRLGEILGVPLYHRVGRQLELTEQGRALETFARDLAARTKGFAKELREGVDDAPAILAAGRATHLYMLADGLHEWADSGGKLSLLSGDQSFVLDAVLSGRAHLGLAPVQGSGDLDRVLFRSVGQSAVVRTDHALGSRRRVRLTELAEHNLILPPEGRPHRASVDRVFHAAGLDHRVAVEAEGWELMMLYASLGLGAAIVNGYCTPPRGTIMVAIPELPHIDYQLISRRNGYLPPQAASLRKKLNSLRSRSRKR